MKSVKTHRTRRKLQQPPSSFADYTEEATDEDVGKDFRTLISAPFSKGGHFVFKSEKTWSVDSSQYSEFFTLNLKALSAAISGIPFNEYVGVDDKYFTSDQLTSICNNAEEGKAAYGIILNELDTSGSSSVSKTDASRDTTSDQSKNSELAAGTKSQSEDSIDSLEEDIDFLLSLKEPVQSGVTTITQPVPLSHSNDSKQKSKNVSSEPVDLEKWLDFVLND
ncbi:hypothetical protein DMN91_001863 [Ooceraea biroi]|uniref:Cell death regulator Aven n=1 Tax=Ooceraea biroi TaxID=2015173 RepID=A0A026WN56_OOCBI|nr:uncharacterized protein LOC105278152 [Ooceraea biroi]EZA56534.1 hypothetical protein X777_03321 [Ooceraea biroi]RLU25706.1 hypothetical protein DMN91_001863 [Ooceraea biroi]